jgi:carbon monoxide dehydrogenase subunit G
MLTVTASTHVPAPPEEVWDLISDTTRYAEWVEGTDAVTRTDGPAWEGSTYDEANTLLGPWKARTTWRITEYTPHRRQVHTSTDVPLAKRFDVVMELEPQAEGTLFVVTLTATPSLGPIGAAMAKLFRRVADAENRKTVANIADLVAREQAGHPSIPDPGLRDEPAGPAAIRARRLLRADAMFELGLGVPLATGGLTGLQTALELPRPASDEVVKALGAALIPFSAVLWRESARPAPGRLAALAAVNGATGAALAGWLVRSRDGMNPLGAATVGGTAAVLLALAGAEARVARRLR